MQTFVTDAYPRTALHVPRACTDTTAATLDRARLGRQRTEARHIYDALTHGVGYVNHPATRMWAGHTAALAEYGWLMCNEWQRRGFRDQLAVWFLDRIYPADDYTAPDWPWWVGHPAMVSAHRSKLVRKAPEYYGDMWPGDDLAHNHALPYLWPDAEQAGVFRISAAESKRHGDGWDCPDGWKIDPATLIVALPDNGGVR